LQPEHIDIIADGVDSRITTVRNAIKGI